MTPLHKCYTRTKPPWIAARQPKHEADAGSALSNRAPRAKDDAPTKLLGHANVCGLRQGLQCWAACRVPFSRRRGRRPARYRQSAAREGWLLAALSEETSEPPAPAQDLSLPPVPRKRASVVPGFLARGGFHCLEYYALEPLYYEIL